MLYETEEGMRCDFIMIVSGIGMEKENSKCLKSLFVHGHMGDLARDELSS